jgi:hypothetical protein
MVTTRHIAEAQTRTIAVYCPECLDRCILKVADGLTTQPAGERQGSVLAHCRYCRKWQRIVLYARAA